jgi:hypothetical protein
MSRRRMDDSGQIHTIEGIVSGMVIVLALMYILSSITFVSPQTEKTTVMKMSILSQDILNVLSTPDQPGNYTNPLARNISKWQGGVADPGQSYEVNPGEPSILWLNDKIQSLVPPNVMYNVDLLYINDTASAAEGHLVFDNKPVIFMGDPHDNAVTASKLVVVNYYDVNNSVYSYWNHTVIPKTVEVQLALWYI